MSLAEKAGAGAVANRRTIPPFTDTRTREFGLMPSQPFVETELYPRSSEWGGGEEANVVPEIEGVRTARTETGTSASSSRRKYGGADDVIADAGVRRGAPQM